MIVLKREDAPVAIAGDGVELRKMPAGALSVAFVQARQGTDLRPACAGLPGDLCPCPHWGFILKGKVRMHTADGHVDFQAGDVVYWAPGHAPEMLEDTEYVDFSPTSEFDEVIRHLSGQPG